MIKWLLKKFFIGLLIWLPIVLINFSSAFDYVVWNGISTQVLSEVWDLVSSPFSSSYDISITNQWHLLSSNGVVWRKMLYMNNNFIFMRGGNWVWYFYITNSFQGKPNEYFICDQLTWGSVPTNCSSVPIWDITYSVWASFLEQVKSNDLFFVWYERNYWNWSCSSYNQQSYNICISSSVYQKSYCWAVWVLDRSGCNVKAWLIQNYTSVLTWSYNLDNPSFDTINEAYLRNPPRNVWTWNNLITWDWYIDWYDFTAVNSGDYVLYYEEKWFNRSMCYIWTNDLITTRNTWENNSINFVSWSGLTIFDMYSQLFNTTDFSNGRVWDFINVWLFNYNSWFNWQNRFPDWQVKSNMYFSGINNFWTIMGPWLSNPFLSNLYAYYFLWSLVDYRPYLKINNSLFWEDLAVYCYYRLSDYSSSWFSYNVINDHSKNIDSNVSIYSRNEQLYRRQFSWLDTINSQSRHWTPLDYFDDSQGNYTDFESFFSDSFNRFKDTFGNGLDPSDFGVWILPWYIILFLLAIIFFRFLSH